MANLDTSMAPGCFGLGLLYKAASTECSTCPFAAQCAPIAEAQLVKMRADLGILPVPAGKSAAPDPTATKGVFATGLPIKVQQLVDAIERAGIKVNETLARHENPFGMKFPFMRIACHILLRRKEQNAGTTRMELTQAFCSTLKVEKGTADAYVIHAAKALAAIGAADEVNGVLKLRAS